ncbi:MAG: aspartate carbamoyltransferase regulatory subunit, partial [Muribaculaceae bacterium]|nr:aspartate carbamoyltransferase regulatory subunit [Muribaculaceae bacterium]
ERLGKKGIIKMADVTFPEETLNRIAVIAPRAVINIIKDYDVVEKYMVAVPDELNNIVRCNNPKCISNNEPMRTRFHVIDRENIVLRCHHCECTVHQEEIELK